MELGTREEESVARKIVQPRPALANEDAAAFDPSKLKIISSLQEVPGGTDTVRCVAGVVIADQAIARPS